MIPKGREAFFSLLQDVEGLQHGRTLADLTGFFRLWEGGKIAVFGKLCFPGIPRPWILSEVLEGSVWSSVNSRNMNLLFLLSVQ